MTLQTSGAITLAQIQTEFGGSNPISMSEYYAGGAYVPSGTSGTNGAVPTSGQISFSQFYGTSNYLDLQTLTAVSVDSSTYYGDPIGDYDYFLNHGVTPGGGSISPGSTSIYSGATWLYMEWNYSYGVFASGQGVGFTVYRPLASGSIPNSGWTTATITSPAAASSPTSFNRTSLNYSTTSDANYYYASWYTSPGSTPPDPFLDGTFNATGATVTVKFT